jgi:hypothetical protein
MIRCAKLNEQGDYLGMVEIEEAQLTPQHLRQIDVCDLEPGKYRWVADEANPMGGAFFPIAYLELREKLASEVAEEEKRRAFLDEAKRQGVPKRKALASWRRLRAEAMKEKTNGA